MRPFNQWQFIYDVLTHEYPHAIFGTEVLAHFAKHLTPHAVGRRFGVDNHASTETLDLFAISRHLTRRWPHSTCLAQAL